jgi:hypothetical protein
MQLRCDLDAYVCVPAEEQSYVASPMAGVERILLDRVGDEVAVATSIVRYAPASHFPAHDHALGEEFIVLDGVFSDEHGDFPPFTYVRNPPGTRHTPFSEPGCTIFVKLRQFATDDLTPRCLPLNQTTPEQGVEVDTLHVHGAEQVCLIRAAAGERIALPAAFEAREGFVLQGAVGWQTDTTRTLRARSWLRVPPGCPFRLQALEPSIIFAKTRPRSSMPQGSAC